MKYGSFRDRIPDELKPDREGWAHIAMAALIAVLASSLIVLALLPARATTADITRLDAADVALLEDIADLQNAGPYATTEELEGVTTSVTDYALDVIDLKWRVTAVENDLDGVINSPYEWQLDGGYQLYVKGSGNFTANIHLCFAPAVATDATDYAGAVAFFYAGVNWTAASQAYIPVVAVNGTAWSVTQAWFNIGVFEVDTEGTLDITVAGLNATYNAAYAYAEVYEL